MTLLYESGIRSRSRARATLAITVLATALAGCLAESPTSTPKLPDPLPPTPFVVSDPIATSAASGSPARTAPLGASATVWISLPVGSLPNANGVTIYVPSTGAQVSVVVTDGGFDPVGVVADVGDTLVAIVTDVVPGKPTRYVMLVPAISVPVVVRSSPPPHKRDVPLNAIMMITFSEPMDSASLVRAIGMRADTTAVVGTLKALVSGGVVFRAVFTPTDSLAPLTTYVLRVGTAAEDVQGDSLRAPVTVDFTTVADSVVVPPDSTPQPPDSTPKPPAADTGAHLVTFLAPVPGDTIPVDFPHLRFTLSPGTYSEFDFQLLNGDGSPVLQGVFGVIGTFTSDSTTPWNYWSAGFWGYPTGTFDIVLHAVGVLGDTASGTVRAVTFVAPDTTPRILVRSFSVIEYQYPGDSTWYYAPQLVASDAPGQTGLQIVGFDMLNIPGVGGGPVASTPFAVPANQDTPVLSANYGEYDLSYFVPDGRRSTGGVATARLTYRDAANHYYAVNLQSPITTGGLPSTYSGDCAHWISGLYEGDYPATGCPGSVRQIAVAPATVGMRPVFHPHVRPTRTHQ